MHTRGVARKKQCLPGSRYDDCPSFRMVSSVTVRLEPESNLAFRTIAEAYLKGYVINRYVASYFELDKANMEFCKFYSIISY